MASERDFHEGESKFNKALDDLRRIAVLEEQANMMRCVRTWEGYSMWMSILSALDCELSPYLSDKEEKELGKLRVRDMPGLGFKKVLGNVPPHQITMQLDRWDRELRRLITRKGMALTPKETNRSFILPGG